MNVETDQVREIFLAALKVPPEQRAGCLHEACGSDQNLRQRIERLLQAHLELGSIAEPNATWEQLAITECPGTLIGSYKLLQQIGEGGMGVVWMAEQTQPVQRKVALKVIKPGMDSRQVIARFEAERQALAMMDHVNIARVFDGGATDTGRPYFVMELVHGVPITKYCDDNHLTPRERLELFVPVCQAIQHAHQKGIIHRDIKPSNVMVTLYDGKPVPKVIDFGVAKATEQKLTERTLFTQYGTMVGTLEYMSPEQAEMSALGVDTRGDIYSLGVLLYELLTGSTPLTHKRMKEAAYGEILRMIKEEEPPKPSTRLSDSGEALASISANRHTEPAKLTKLVRGELDWIVMKTLEKDRNRRYETAKDFAADVQRYLADEPVQACPPSAGYRLRKFARRNKAALTMASVLAVAVVLVIGSVGWMLRVRAAHKEDAAREREARQARIVGQVELILAEVERLQKGQKWPEALAAAQRAEAAVTSGEADAATAQQVRALLKDLELIDRLEQIRMQSATIVEGKFDNAGQADRDYARAFRDYGVDALELAVETSIDRLKARTALVIPLAAALDDWVGARRLLSEKGAAGWKRLVAVARGIDPEPLRDRLRSTWGQPVSDVKDELRRLADSIDIRAQHPATLVSLARTLKLAKHPESARRVLRDAQYIYPADFWLNSELASALYEQKDHEGAIRFYTAAVSIRPNSAAAHTSLGAGLFGQKKLDEAIACYRRAIDLEPKSAQAYSNLGDGLAGQKKLDEAFAAQKKAIELDPKNARAYVGLGNTLRIQKKLPEAIDAYKKAIEVNPKSALAYSNLGALLGDALKDHDQAIECFRKAIEIDPDYADAYGNLGIVLSKKGWDLANSPDPKLRDPKRAVELGKEAVEIAPHLPQSLQRLGWIQYRTANWKASIEALEKSCQLEKGGTGDGGQWIVLALAHAKLAAQDGLPEKEREHHRTEARRWYDQADKQIDGRWRVRPGDVFGQAIWDFHGEARELMGTNDSKK